MAQAIQHKTCTSCSIGKPLAEFYADHRGLFGVRSICKTCLKTDTTTRRRAKQKPRPTIIQQFESKIERSNECWNWTAHIAVTGYGMFQASGSQPVYAHRFSYELYVGPIPDGLTIDHLCFNRKCVNPQHLEPVSLAENVRRAQVKQRRTHDSNCS